MSCEGTSLESLGAPPFGCNLTGLVAWLTTFYHAVCAALGGGGGGGGASGAVPIGAVMEFAGATPPTGWLFCAGALVSRTTYANLFSAIGTTFGAGDGITTFALPDLRGYVSAAPDNMGGSDAGRIDVSTPLGHTMGAQKHTLSITEIPSHNHTLPLGGASAGSSGSVFAQSGSGLVTGNAGGGGAHNNMQPTFFINKIIYTGV